MAQCVVFATQVLRYLMLQSCTLIFPFKIPFLKLILHKTSLESTLDHIICAVHSIGKTPSIDAFILSITSTLDPQRFCTVWHRC